MRRLSAGRRWAASLVFALLALACFGTMPACGQDQLPAHVSLAPGFTRTLLSDYFSELRGSPLDTPVFAQTGLIKGGSVLVLGGTHPSEPAGYLAAILLLERAQVTQGRLLIIPFANRSAFSHAEGYDTAPDPLSFTLRDGSVRTFTVGARYANPAHLPPDPAVYLHQSSGHKYAGKEIRNLNRVYPGAPTGSPVEQLAFGVMALLRKENVTLAVDLHEAHPDSPVADTIVAHEKSMELAVAAALDLSAMGIALKLEFSPPTMRGLSHREWGDGTAALPVLLETVNPGKGKDIDRRIARHVTSVDVLVQSLTASGREDGIVITGLPSYQDILKNGTGAYLSAVPKK